jgi:hypothetical protein
MLDNPEKKRNIWPTVAFFHCAVIITLYMFFALMNLAAGFDDYIYSPVDPVWQYISHQMWLGWRIFYTSAILIAVGSVLLFIFPKWKLFTLLAALEVGFAITITYLTYQALQVLPS